MKQLRFLRSAGALLASAVVLSGLFFGQSLAEPVASYDPTQIKDFGFGIFCNRSADYVTKGETSIDDEVDRFDVAPPLIKQTQVIPAVDGLLFGVQAISKTPSEIVVTMVVKHPPLGDTRLTRETWESAIVGDRMTMNGYVIGLDQGNPFGTWTIKAVRQGRKVYEVTFEVVEATNADRRKYKSCKGAKVS